MRNTSNQLPPEFNHLGDEPNAAGVDPEAFNSKAHQSLLEKSPLNPLKPDRTLMFIASTMVCIVIIVLLVKQFSHQSEKSVGDHYAALERIDTSERGVETSATDEALNSKADTLKSTGIDASRALDQTVDTTSSVDAVALAQADTKSPQEAWSDKTNENAVAQINQRLSAIESIVDKLQVSNESHTESLDRLCAEQAQLLVKVQGNETTLADMKNRVDVMQKKIVSPSIRVKNDSNTNASQDDKNTLPLVKTRITIPVVTVPTTHVNVPVKPIIQLPSNVRLVILKNMNGKNTVVLRMGGEFSPMLFEGQTWMGIQILSARVHDRSAQVLFQGDEFGLVL